MKLKLEKFKAFEEAFKKLPVLKGNIDDYVLTVKNDEALEIRTIEEEWCGVILANVLFIASSLDLQFFIERTTFNLIVH
jgi:hypothetical protein